MVLQEYEVATPWRDDGDRKSSLAVPLVPSKYALAQYISTKIRPLQPSTTFIQQDEKRVKQSEAKIEGLFDSYGASPNANFHEIMRELHILEDHADGVESRYVAADDRENPAAMPLYIRDGRSQERTMKGVVRPKRYCMMGLSRFEIVRKLINLHLEKANNLGESDFIQKNAKTFFLQSKMLENEADANQHLAYTVDKILAPYLAQKLNLERQEGSYKKAIEKAKEMIETGRDFINIDREAFATATITQHPVWKDGVKSYKEILHIDKPLYALSTGLRNEYLNRRDKVWYKIQPPYIQKLIDHYLTKILDGSLQSWMLPTLIRKYIPGLRHAGLAQVFERRPNGVLIFIGQGCHSGNLGHEFTFPKGMKESMEVNEVNATTGRGSVKKTITEAQLAKENERLTAMVAKQIRFIQEMEDVEFVEGTEYGDKLFSTGLVTPHKALSTLLSDKQVEYNMQKDGSQSAADSKGKHCHSLLPGNALRIAPTVWNKYSGIDEILGLVIKNSVFAGIDLAALVRQYPDGMPRDKTLVGPELAKHKVMQVAIEVYRLRHRARIWDLDQDHRNFQLNGHAKHLVSLFNDAFGTNHTYIDFCKSGKDREGVARLKWVSMMLHFHFYGEPLTISHRTDMPRVWDNAKEWFAQKFGVNALPQLPERPSVEAKKEPIDKHAPTTLVEKYQRSCIESLVNVELVQRAPNLYCTNGGNGLKSSTDLPNELSPYRDKLVQQTAEYNEMSPKYKPKKTLLGKLWRFAKGVLITAIVFSPLILSKLGYGLFAPWVGLGLYYIAAVVGSYKYYQMHHPHLKGLGLWIRSFVVGPIIISVILAFSLPVVIFLGAFVLLTAWTSWFWERNLDFWGQWEKTGIAFSTLKAIIPWIITLAAAVAVIVFSPLVLIYQFREKIFTWSNASKLLLCLSFGAVAPFFIPLSQLATVLVYIGAAFSFCASIGCYLKDQASALHFPEVIQGSDALLPLRKVGVVNSREAYYMAMDAKGNVAFNDVSDKKYPPQSLAPGMQRVIDGRCDQLSFAKQIVDADADKGKIVTVSIIKHGPDANKYQVVKDRRMVGRPFLTTRQVKGYLVANGYENSVMLDKLVYLGCYKVTHENVSEKEESVFDLGLDRGVDAMVASAFRSVIRSPQREMEKQTKRIQTFSPTHYLPQFLKGAPVVEDFQLGDLRDRRLDSSQSWRNT